MAMGPIEIATGSIAGNGIVSSGIRHEKGLDECSCYRAQTELTPTQGCRVPLSLCR
jgi:hypothetical protein